MFPSPEATLRTKDPVHPARDLNWYNHVLCADCYCVLETCYRIDKQDKTSEYYGLTNKGIIAAVEKDHNDRADFLERKKCRASCLHVAAEDGQYSATHDVGTAVHLIETEGTDESLEEFDFYKWGDYQKDNKNWQPKQLGSRWSFRDNLQGGKRSGDLGQTQTLRQSPDLQEDRLRSRQRLSDDHQRE